MYVTWTSWMVNLSSDASCYKTGSRRCEYGKKTGRHTSHQTKTPRHFCVHHIFSSGVLCTKKKADIDTVTP